MHADVLVLGETHLEYLFWESMSEDETNASIVLAGMMGDEVKLKVTKFGPDRLYLEVRPPMGQGSKDDWFNLRVPQGMRTHFIERARDSDNLDNTERQARMASRLANYLRMHPGGKTVLICGSRHAESVANHLLQRVKRRPIRVNVDYVRIPFDGI